MDPFFVCFATAGCVRYSCGPAHLSSPVVFTHKSKERKKKKAKISGTFVHGISKKTDQRISPLEEALKSHLLWHRGDAGFRHALMEVVHCIEVPTEGEWDLRCPPYWTTDPCTGLHMPLHN